MLSTPLRFGVTMSALALAAGLTSTPALAAESDEIGAYTADLDAAAAAADAANAGAASRFIVTFNNMTTLDEARRMELLNKITHEFSSDASLVRQMHDGSYVVTLNPPVPADKVPSLRGTLESKAEIAYADIDRIQYSTSTSGLTNDRYVDRQWHLGTIGDDYGVDVADAWAKGATGRDVVIAVVDSGITNHSDLNAKVLPGYDMISTSDVSRDGDGRDADPSDAGDWNTNPNFCLPSNSSWHGTHVAGIAAAITNNGTGVAGVAKDAEILPVRALGRCGGYTSDIVDGIVWAAGGDVPGVPHNNHPADVINLSLGGSGRCLANSPYQRAINEANQMGATITVAAGNKNQDASLFTPANCSGVITVGATGPTGVRAHYSNFGDDIDIAAPGGDMAMGEEAGILSTWNNGQTRPGREAYTYMQGTSMATPVVSGVIALMKSVNPDLSNDEIYRILRDTASGFGTRGADWQTRSALGAGIVNAKAAVDAVRGDAPETTPAKPTDPAEPTEPAAPVTPAQPVRPVVTTPVVTTPRHHDNEDKDDNATCTKAMSIFEKLLPGNWC